MSLNIKRDANSFLGPTGHLRPGDDLVAATVDPERQLGSGCDALPRARTTETGRKPPEIRPSLYVGAAASSPRSRPPDQRARSRPQQRQYLTATAVAITTGSTSLPETKQDELKDKPPGERMALVRKLVADHPVPQRLPPRGSFSLSTWATIRRSSWRRSTRSGNSSRRPSVSRSRKCGPGLGGKHFFRKAEAKKLDDRGEAGRLRRGQMDTVNLEAFDT